MYATQRINHLSQAARKLLGMTLRVSLRLLGITKELAERGGINIHVRHEMEWDDSQNGKLDFGTVL